ncbi:MAG: hydroxymethylbilane synthase [Pseudomonadota bacterium]
MKNSIEFIKIKTTGDRILNKNLSDIGGKNLFIKEIEEALIEKQIDFAVHSLKDMTANLDNRLCIAACLKREDPRDAFVSLKYKNINELPEGGLIGTSSIRRKSVVLSERPDLMVVSFRGNVLTRLDKLKQNQVDATFLAVSGLKRLGIDKALYYPLPFDEFLPAISQGVIGVECLAENEVMKILLSSINHEETHICNQAERGFLESLDADCNSPVAAYAKIINDEVHLDCLVINQDNKIFKETVTGPKIGAWDLGYSVGLRLKIFL